MRPAPSAHVHVHVQTRAAALARVAVVACIMGVVGAGCRETPVQGFEKFYAALADGSDDAYGRLSTQAQAQFTGAARAKGLEPAKLLAAAVPRTTVRSVDVVAEHGETAVVEVKDALGRSQRVHMLREDGTWRVDLSPQPQHAPEASP